MARKTLLEENRKRFGRATVSRLQRENKKFQEDKKKGKKRRKVLTRAEKAKAKREEMKAFYKKYKAQKQVSDSIEKQTGKKSGKLKISNKYDFTTM